MRVVDIAPCGRHLRGGLPRHLQRPTWVCRRNLQRLTDRPHLLQCTLTRWGGTSEGR